MEEDCLGNLPDVVIKLAVRDGSKFAGMYVVRERQVDGVDNSISGDQHLDVVSFTMKLEPVLR